MGAQSVIQDAAFLGELSHSALLALMVIALAFVSLHLYKTSFKEMQERNKELIEQVKDTNALIREQIAITKANNDGLIKFIETHCSKVDDELEAIKTDLEKMNERLAKLTQ